MEKELKDELRDALVDLIKNLSIEELDNIAAYNKGMPIRNKDAMNTTLITEPMSMQWIENIRNNWWYSENYEGNFSQDLYKLRDILLSFGGEQTCLPVFESDLSEILQRGQLWLGDRITMKRGRSCACHANSADYWYEHKDETVLCTGYALSKDGMWRQHSWLVLIRPRKNRIIETTVPRIAYFGFAMTYDEAEIFANNNF